MNEILLTLSGTSSPAPMACHSE